jgi:hypothetical protein
MLVLLRRSVTGGCSIQCPDSYRHVSLCADGFNVSCTALTLCWSKRDLILLARECPVYTRLTVHRFLLSRPYAWCTEVSSSLLYVNGHTKCTNFPSKCIWYVTVWKYIVIPEFIYIESIQSSVHRVIYYCESRGFHNGDIMWRCVVG